MDGLNFTREELSELVQGADAANMPPVSGMHRNAHSLPKPVVPIGAGPEEHREEAPAICCVCGSRKAVNLLMDALGEHKLCSPCTRNRVELWKTNPAFYGGANASLS
jgi:hypothetical protein